MNNIDKAHKLMGLIAKGTVLREELRESDDLVYKRKTWLLDTFEVFYAIFGKVPLDFNNPDETGSISEYPGSEQALAFTKQLFSDDIDRLYEYRAEFLRQKL